MRFLPVNENSHAFSEQSMSSQLLPFRAMEESVVRSMNKALFLNCL